MMPTATVRSGLVAALDHVEDGVALYDAAGRFVVSNRRYRELLGKFAEPAPGIPFELMVRFRAEAGFYDISPQEIDLFIARRLARRRSLPSQMELRLRDGRWLRVKDHSTQDGGVISIVTDVTESKRRDSAIKESEQRFREFADQGAEWFWEQDSELRFTYFSPRFAEAFGIDPRALLGKTLGDIARAPADSEAWRAFRGDVAARRPFADFVATVTLPDGRTASLKLGGKPVADPQGSFHGYRGTGADVTLEVEAQERARAAAQRFADAIEHAAEGIALWDRDDRLVECNRRYHDALGPLGHLVQTGVRFETLLRSALMAKAFGPSIGDAESYVAERLKRRRSLPSTIVIELADGRWQQITEVRAADGGTLSMTADVTELKRREVQLEQNEAQARAAEAAALAASDAKSTFLAYMSHELRTPLNAIGGFAEIMSIEPFGPLDAKRYREYANDIHESAMHMLGLISDVLDLTKVEAGHEELVESEVDIEAAVQSALTLVGGRALRGGVGLTSWIAPNLPRFRADERRLKQILANLLGNAIKFTKPEGTVHVSAELGSDGGLVLAVSDSGIGMSPTEVTRALEPFGQVDNILTRSHEGTGLGLPLARALVELHGGTLDIDSQPGRGTTVLVRLPVSRRGA